MSLEKNLIERDGIENTSPIPAYRNHQATTRQNKLDYEITKLMR